MTNEATSSIGFGDREEGGHVVRPHQQNGHGRRVKGHQKRLSSGTTQSQWIFRNVTLHDSIRGTPRLQKREEVLQEVKTLLETDPLRVPAEKQSAGI